jgi:hypothetical protein
MIGPSIQVVEGLIIACFETIRICRTLAIHDRLFLRFTEKAIYRNGGA